MKSVNSSLLAFLFLGLVLSNVLLPENAEGQESVPLKVTKAVWGSSTDAPTEGFPGDSALPLTITVQNLSPDKTIKGVLGSLSLGQGYLKDVYGYSTPTATGEPTVGEILNPTDEIKPKGFFTLTYTIDIDENAVPGTYAYALLVEYSVGVPASVFNETQYVEGVPQSLVASIVISKTASTITITGTPTTVGVGEAIRISGAIQPAVENVTIVLNYTNPQGYSFNHTIKTKRDGSYSESYRLELEGTWTVNASWTGDAKHDGDWVLATFEARAKTMIDVVAASNRIVGGQDNIINVTITNPNSAALSALDITLTVPQPLVLQGTNHWLYSYLGPSNSVTTSIKIFAPMSSAGSTFSATLAVTYRDDYGQSATSNHPIGLIVSGKAVLVSPSISISTNRVKGGLDTDINLTITNEGSGDISALELTLTVPQPLVFHGTNRWTFKEMKTGASQSIPLKLYAPKTSIGATYTATLNLSYRNELGDSSTSTYPIGLIVCGNIELVTYDSKANPDPVRKDSKIEITTTLLNRGNTPALYVNASILDNPILVLTRESTSYVGEVEENSPAPFTLAANIGPDVENGTYQVDITLTYRDDQNVDHQLQTRVYVSVLNTPVNNTGSGSSGGLMSVLSQTWLVLVTMVGASATIALLYRRRLKKGALTGQGITR